MTPMKKSDNSTPQWSRTLVLGASKIGKSTAVINSMPRPLVLNCDGKGANQFAASQPSRDEWEHVVVDTKKDLDQAVKLAEKGVSEGTYETIVVDTVSVLASNLQYELGLIYSGYDMWDQLRNVLLRMYIKLDRLPAHIVYICHLRPPVYDENKKEIDVDVGSLPDIGGSAAREFPKRVGSVILFQQEIAPGKDGGVSRWFLTGPQKNWNVSSRGQKTSVKIPAEQGLPAVLNQLGFHL